MNSMSSEELDSFTSDVLTFVAEQIGIPENEFKEVVVDLLQKKCKPLRTYLAQIEYGKTKDFNIALCVDSSFRDDEQLISDIALIFRRMFSLHEHLDILFLDDEKESELRKVCCPFYSSERFNQPDFYLTSSEGYNLEEIRACYKQKRLMGNHPDGYMLCEIVPPILGQPYGLGGQDINEIVIASRHVGYSVFKINEWPCYVHVARLMEEIPDNKFAIIESDIESIGWAEIYESSASIKPTL